MKKGNNNGQNNPNIFDNIFMTEFEKESDRASVILAVSMLDQALESLLKTRLVHISTSDDNLLEGNNSPISTFSSRIDLAFRVGLISSKFCRDLHIIRKIRNEFAHNIMNCNYESSSIINRIIELKRSSGFIDRWQRFRSNFCEGLKGDLQMTISWMLFHLWQKVNLISPIQQAEDEWGYRKDVTADNQLEKANAISSIQDLIASTNEEN